MRVSLAIDTSTSRTLVSVVAGEEEIWSKFQDGATAHGPALPTLVAEAIKNARIDQVVVGMGPGPFTGLRVGIAFARTFALARSIPVIGVCSLDAIALPIGDKDFIVSVDARRKEVYWARYVDGIREGEPRVNFPADVAGAKIYLDLFPDMRALVNLSKSQNILLPYYLRRPDAVATAERPLITLRAATALDIPVLTSLDRQLFPYSPWSVAQFKEEFAGIPNTRHFLVAANEKQEIVGYAGVFAPAVGVEADITTVGVIEGYRKQGIATDFISRLENWSRTRGASAMMLEVKSDNLAAIRLYVSLGYLKISIRMNYYGPDMDAQVLRKEL